MSQVSGIELPCGQNTCMPIIKNEAHAEKIAAVTARLYNQHKQWAQTDSVPTLNDPLEVIAQGGHTIVHAAGNLAVRSARPGGRKFTPAIYATNMALGVGLGKNLEQLKAFSDTQVYGVRIHGTSCTNLRTEDVEQIGMDGYRDALYDALAMQRNGLASDNCTNMIAGQGKIAIFDYMYKPEQPLTEKVRDIAEFIVYGGMVRIRKIEGERSMSVEMMSRAPHAAEFVMVCDEVERADPEVWAGARDAAIAQARIVSPSINAKYPLPKCETHDWAEQSWIDNIDSVVL